MLISRGSIDPSGSYPSLRLSASQKEFLEWIAEQLGVFVTSVTLHKTAEEIREMFEARGMTCENPQPEYRLTMMSHPDLEPYSVRWYRVTDEGTREKQLPTSIPYSPTTLRTWYAFSGHIERSKSPSDVVFPVTQHRGDIDVLIKLCQRYNPRVYTDDSGEKTHLSLHLRNAAAFFDDIGSAPVKSLESKWPTDDDRLRADDDVGQVCPDCGLLFSNLNSHWAGETDCEYPAPTQRQEDILLALVLGGAYINKTGPEKLPHLMLDSTNREFLDWLDDELGILTSHITERASAEDARTRLSAEFDTSPKETRDVYRFQTRGLPYFESIEDWASRRGDADRRLSPPGVTRSLILLKTMYLHRGSTVDYTQSDETQVVIRMGRVAASDETMLELFEPFDGRLRQYTSEFRVLVIGDTEQFFEYVGEPPAFAVDQWV
jgi:hypothetical protein